MRPLNARFWLALLLLLPLAHAQVLHPNPFASSTSNSTTHDVAVGKSGLTFQPSSVHAQTGDTINFHFYSSNHSLAESTYDRPCQPKSGGVDTKSIFSGFVPTTQDRGQAMHMFSMQVNSSDPIWLYCSQQSHYNSGMAMVINALPTQSLQDYIDASKSAGSTVSPTEVYGGVLMKDNAASPNITASGAEASVASATATKKSAASALASDGHNHFTGILLSIVIFILTL